MLKHRRLLTLFVLLFLIGPATVGATVGTKEVKLPDSRLSGLLDVGAAAAGRTSSTSTASGTDQVISSAAGPSCLPSQISRLCTLEVLDVASPALSPATGQKVVEAFGLQAKFQGKPVLENGVLRYIDDQLFQAIPSLAATPPIPLPDSPGLPKLPVPDLFGEESEDPRLDFVNLLAIAERASQGALGVLSDASARSIVAQAFSAAGAIPENATALVTNSKMELAHNPNSSVPALPLIGPKAEILLDTQVSYLTSFNGIPVRGPGSNVSVTLNPDGVVTQLQYAARRVTSGAQRAIVSPALGPALCRSQLGLDASASVTSELVYYAPPLDAAVSAVLPSFECNSVLADGTHGLSTFIPAVQNGPRASFVVSTSGNSVHATASVLGGTAPYSFSWTSSATAAELQPGPGPDVTYLVRPRAPVPNVTERLLLTVTDAEGLTAVARSSFAVDASGAGAATSVGHDPASNDIVASAGELLAPATGLLGPSAQSHAVSGNQVGAEGGTSSPDCLPYTTGWTNGNTSKGTPSQFQYNTDWAWSTDFKSDTLVSPNTGDDHNFADDVDMMFYCGHGSANSFTFENTSGPSDKNVSPDELRLGDRDLEWFALLSCQVLSDTVNGSTWNTRWGPAFNGLHEMLGFHTNASASGNLGADLAKHMHGYNVFNTAIPPKKIHEAWVQAVKDGQPAGRVWATILPVSTSSTWNRNDYFWGRGEVSADIPADQIYYFVRYSGTV